MYVQGIVSTVARHAEGVLVEATPDTPLGAEFPAGTRWTAGERRTLSYRMALPPWLRPVPVESPTR